MKKVFFGLLIIVFIGSVVSVLFFFRKQPLTITNPLLPSPPKELPLLKYQITTLRQQSFPASRLILEKKLKSQEKFSSYTFSYQTTGKKMTGLINIPQTGTASSSAFPVIVMVRGYIPPATYQPGSGTKNAAEFFASHGFITVAPDFLGFGEGDSESTDVWESRFQKPVQIVELINTMRSANALDVLQTESVVLDTSKIGIWAHSNGGQITLTALELLSQPIPTTLWAPVTAPFPYSILYFSDEEADEGLASRNWIHEFDQDYDAKEFSFTQHLDLLKGPLQIHQGVADEAFHYIWSDEFVDKIKAENVKRKHLAATASAEAKMNFEPIEIEYFKYPNSNHNMQPDWSTVIQRDLEFFQASLK